MFRLFKSKCHLNFLKSLFNEKYLLYTNVAISVTSSGVGDLISQKYELYEGRLETFSGIRTRNMCASGFSIGLFCHYWYNILDRKLPGNSLPTVIKKIIVDQFICSPLCIATLFLTVGYLEGATGRRLLKEAKEKGVKLYLAEWIVWPTAQFVNFYLISPKHRVLYDSAVSLGYDIYTSAVKHTSDQNQDSHKIQR